MPQTSKLISLVLHGIVIVMLLLLARPVMRTTVLHPRAVTTLFTPPPVFHSARRTDLRAAASPRWPAAELPRRFVPPPTKVVAAVGILPLAALDAPPLLQPNAIWSSGPVGSSTTLGGGGSGGVSLGSGKSGGGDGGDEPSAYAIGGLVTAPVPVRTVEPEYSDEARKARISGNVLVYAEIDASGHPKQLRITRGLGLGLDERAIEAVSQWLFRPGMRDGKAVAVRATFAISFRLL